MLKLSRCMAIHEIHSCKECATGMHWGERIVVLSVGKNYRHCLDELFTHHSRVASQWMEF